MNRLTSGLSMAAALLALAGPAMAQRSIQSDDPATPPLSFTPCTLGVTGCAGIPAFSDEFAGRFSADGSTTLYIYREGVVSFGAELPDGASVAGGTASLGTGNWFAPSFGAPIDVQAFNDFAEAAGQYRINWSDGGDTLFQLFIADDPFDDPTTVSIGLNGVVQPGSVIAYNYTPFGWDPPPGFTPPSIDPHIDAIGLDVASSYNSGLTGSVTPEPGSWALMLLGFGALGAALRRRRRATALPA